MEPKNQWMEVAKNLARVILVKYGVIIGIVLSVLLIIALLVGFIFSAVNTMAPFLNQKGDACKTQSDFNRFNSQINTMPTDSPSRADAQKSLDSYKEKYKQGSNLSGVQGQMAFCMGVTGSGGGLPLIRTDGSLTGRINNFYGDRSLGFHHGIDLEAGVGTPIYAVSSGTVIDSTGDEYDYDCPDVDNCNYNGNRVKIRGDDGYEIWYWHLTHNGNLVNVGDRVEVGQPVGLAGSTGRSTGAHLHLGVYQNRDAVDPLLYMLTKGVNLDQSYGVSSGVRYDQGPVMQKYCDDNVTHWSWC